MTYAKNLTTMSKENINLPKAPKDLCFTELDFIQVGIVVMYFKLTEFQIFKIKCFTIHRKTLMSIRSFKSTGRTTSWKLCGTI